MQDLSQKGAPVLSVQLLNLLSLMDGGVKFKCVSKFCYLGDMLMSSMGVGVEEVARTSVVSIG